MFSFFLLFFLLCGLISQAASIDGPCHYIYISYYVLYKNLLANKLCLCVLMQDTWLKLNSNILVAYCWNCSDVSLNVFIVICWWLSTAGFYVFTRHRDSSSISYLTSPNQNLVLNRTYCLSFYYYVAAPLRRTSAASLLVYISSDQVQSARLHRAVVYLISCTRIVLKL